MPIRTFSILGMLAGAAMLGIPGCRPDVPRSIDRAALESPATAAVLRLVAAGVDDSARAAEIGVIVLGPRLDDSSPAFRESLADLPVKLIPGDRLTQYWVGPVARVMDRESRRQPLQLQIAEVQSRPDGDQEIVAAWAFGDHMERRRYLARRGSDGGWAVEPLEVIEKKP